jgi:hypothetical protein
MTIIVSGGMTALACRIMTTSKRLSSVLFTKRVLASMMAGLVIIMYISGCAGNGTGSETAVSPDSESEAPPDTDPVETPAEEIPPPATPDEGLPTEEIEATEPVPEETDWAPTTNSVWQLSRDPVATRSTEACPEPVPFDFYGLVAIAPDPGGLTWQRQTSSDVLERTDTNNYSGPAQSPLSGYALTIDVTFTSEITLTVIHTLIPEDNPDCHHEYEYTGDFSW